MKIGFDAKRAFYNDRGLGNYSRSIIKSLSVNYPQNTYCLYSPKSRSSKDFGESFLSDNMFVNHRKHWSGALWRTLSLGNQIIKDQIDVYHGLSNEIPIRRPGSKTRYFVTIHDLIFLRYPRFYTFIDRQIYYQKIRYAASHADHIIAPSNNTRNDLISHFKMNKDKITVVNPACDEVFFQQKSKLELNQTRQKFNLPDQFLLFVGALTRNKNVISILKAMVTLKEPDYHLVIVGNGPDRKHLMRFCQKHGLTNHVRFLDGSMKVTAGELSGIYQLSTVTILPSHYEGFGLPIIESLAGGTPVIASDNSSLAEVGSTVSILVNVGNPEDLAGAIHRICSETKLRASLSESGKLYARNFHPDKQAKKLMNLYTQLCH